MNIRNISCTVNISSLTETLGFKGAEFDMSEWERFREKIVNLQSDLGCFKVEFLDRDGFKRFVDNLSGEMGGYDEICITGYFSEAIREPLEAIVRFGGRKLRLISQEFNISDKRDRKNLEVIRKLRKAGAEIRVNNRLHARFLVARNSAFPKNGLLVLGSFDFNMECISKERHDAGIRTTNPDLIDSALNLFEEIWNDAESVLLEEKYPLK